VRVAASPMRDVARAYRGVRMRRAAPIWAFLFLLVALTSAAQEPQGQVPTLETVTAIPAQKLQVQQPPTVRALPRSILSDQKHLWLGPFRVERNDVP